MLTKWNRDVIVDLLHKHMGNLWCIPQHPFFLLYLYDEVILFGVTNDGLM